MKTKETVKPHSARKGRIIAAVLYGLVFTLGVTIFVVCGWVQDTYHISLNELLYTMLSPLKGTGQSVVTLGLQSCLPAILIAVAIYCVLFVFLCQSKHPVTVQTKRGPIDLLKWLRRGFEGLSVLLLISSLIYTNSVLDVTGYLRDLHDETTLYDEYYIDPTTVEISPSGEKKNLIYIYLESMETAYASTDDGGAQKVNYIPNLTQLAGENLSFSNSEQLGGFHTLQGTTWTMGALFATSTGVPYAFPVGENSMGKYEHFASGITSLGDILAEQGYTQEFLCGSDADFGGRRSFFEDHGGYEIFDYATAIERGYIDEDYYVWWGYEDAILYEIAKDELTRLAAEDAPFNFTFLTVDTHHSSGYVCQLCGDEYSGQLENVLLCADRQLGEFIAWCKEQSFYEDTVIVISGDHPRMDKDLVGGVDDYDRTVYNCFVNTGTQPQLPTTNRDFTTMDMFPTVLSAMGFEIEGDRLGLGVNLFSDQPTLLETLGYEYFSRELAKHSEFYIQNFS